MNICNKILLIFVTLSIISCGGNKNKDNNTETTETSTQTVGKSLIPNPWSDTDAQGIKELCGYTFSIPTEAQNVNYRKMDGDTLSEVNFKIDDTQYTVRIKQTSDFQDFAGVYLDWKTQDSCLINKCKGIEKRAMSEGYIYELILWQNTEKNLMCSLFAKAENIDSDKVKIVAKKIIED